jgi:hypothetical protein
MRSDQGLAIGPASHSVCNLGLACAGRCRGIVIEAADEVRLLLAEQLRVRVERGSDRLMAG